MPFLKKVSVMGFQISLNRYVPFDSLINELKGVCDRDIINGRGTNVLYLDEAYGYVIGSSLTLKGHRKTIESKRDANGDLVVEHSEINSEATGIEPTLFAINPITRRGVYYRNYGGPSLNALQRIFRNSHDKLRKEALDLAVATEYEKKPNGDVEKSKRKIREGLAKQYAGNLQIQVLATEDDLAFLLGKYQRLNRCEITATRAIESAPLFTPLTDVIRESRVTLRFDNKRGFSKVMEAVLNAFKNPDQYKTLKLLGQGLDGEDLSEYVGDVKQYYHSYSYDDFIEELPARVWKEYTDSRAMGRLIDIITKNTASFGENH